MIENPTPDIPTTSQTPDVHVDSSVYIASSNVTPVFSSYYGPTVTRASPAVQLGGIGDICLDK